MQQEKEFLEKEIVDKKVEVGQIDGLSQEHLESQQEVGVSYWSLVKHQFKKNKLAVISLYIVIFLIFLALTADFLANSKPLYVVYNGETYFPVIKNYLNDIGINKWDPELINVNWKELDNQNKLESVVWPLCLMEPAKLI